MQTPIHFGPFALNLETEELRKAGSLIRLRPQAFKLLAFLANRHGKLVSHQAAILAAAISPDGRFLAYSDDAAVYLKIIETGETHALRALRGYRISYLSWF